MFLDTVTVHIESGKGGNGSVSWLKEKFIAFGGPAGGDGGKGGSVYIEASSQLQTLIDFKDRAVFKATNGEKGGNKNCHGKQGQDLTLKVPVGTVIRDLSNQEVIADLHEEGQIIMVALGGRGGRGNARFASSRKQAPYFAEPGEPAIERILQFELKTIADVGLLGMPNAGKSTFISVVSAAKPKIAAYPFTTLIPNLGVVKKPMGDDGVVLADIPGLIEGASQGVGLGHDFLRHVERTRLLLHLVDMTQDNPLQAYQLINRELALYSDALTQKPQLLVLTKGDAFDEEEQAIIIDEFKAALGDELELFTISSVARQGLEPLMHRVFALLDSMEPEGPLYEDLPEDVAATDNDDSAFEIDSYETTEGERIFEVTSGKLRRWVEVIDIENWQSLNRLLSLLKALGVFKQLKKAGIEEGDTVIVEGASFDYAPFDD